MFPTFLSPLYPLTDVGLSGLSHAEQVETLSDGGATLIQIREKTLPSLAFYLQARDALAVARRRGVRLIINDRVDIALALAADGVHLGQDDLPPEAARSMLGDHAIIGFSTHNAEQARQAIRLPVNYLAIGPIFSTTSKSNPVPAIGLDGLREVRLVVRTLPLVAIGGITQLNARQVIEAGADAVAVISTLLSEPRRIANRTRAFLDSLST